MGFRIGNLERDLLADAERTNVCARVMMNLAGIDGDCFIIGMEPDNAVACTGVVPDDGTLESL